MTRTAQKIPFLIFIVHLCLLRNCCLATDVVSLFVSQSLPINGSTCHSPATCSHAWPRLLGTEKVDENKSQISERKCLLGIHCPTKENWLWRITYNSELYKLYYKPNIVKAVNAGDWGGWVNVSEQTEVSPLKKVTFCGPDDTRRMIRPKRMSDDT
jgi:hypothetical protein